MTTDYNLERIEEEIKTRSDEELREIQRNMKIYSTKLYYSQKYIEHERVEYVLAKIEDEFIIREIKSLCPESNRVLPPAISDRWPFYQ